MTKANCITLCAIAMGIICVFFLFNGLVWPVFLLCPIIFIMDVLDGYVARKYHCASAIGLQLDSLADSFNFGVMIVLLVYVANDKPLFLIPLGVVFSLCAFWRLARFNVNAGSQSGFYGLPSTDAAACLFVLCGLSPEAWRPMVVGVVMPLLSYLMIANFPYSAKRIVNRVLYLAVPVAALLFVYRANF